MSIPILRFKDKDGNISSVPAIKGDKGYTPVKGIDYFTDADKQEIINAVLAALPNGDEVSY